MDADRWERKRQRWESRRQRRQAHWNFPGRHLFSGVLLMVVGGIFLLGNMGLVDAHQIFQFWPMIFIVMGVMRIVASGDDFGHSGGVFWILVGCLFLSGSVPAFRGILRNVWPVIGPVMLIGLGAFLLWRSSMVRRIGPFWPGGSGGTSGTGGSGGTGGTAGTGGTGGSASTGGETASNAASAQEPPSSSNSILSAMAILGGVDRKNNCQDFRGGDVTAIMGGCHIDLRGASITTPHEPVLEVFAMWGGIEIWVPPDWTVIGKVGPILGGYDDHTQPPRDESKRLVVRGTVVMGGIEVRN